jgi:outer membrane murein-binding lipoprotein Lpp
MFGASNPKRLAGIAVMVLFAAVVVSLRKPTVYSKSYNSWKQQYEQATKDLQQRIAALEQQIEAAAEEK